jgi:hypothetical protein
VVTSLSLATIQHFALVLADESAPRFAPAQEPLSDNRTFTATDGAVCYRPALQLATRSGQIPGPDVRFLKDADGVVRLQIEIEEKPSGFENARPFPVRVDSLTLVWSGGSKALPHPSLFFHEERPGHEPRLVIRAGVPLAANEVEPIYHAMQADARLDLVLSYGYWVEQPAAGGTPTPGTGASVTGPTLADLLGSTALPGIIMARPERLTPLRTPRVRTPEVRPQPETAALTPAATRAWRRAWLRNPQAAANIADLRRPGFDWRKLKEAEEQLATRPDFRTAALTRTISLRLDANLVQNRPIYAAIRTENSRLHTTWTDTPFGFIRQAEFANTVYRLPDELRLAFNPALGAPHILPHLYRSDDESVRVRVTLRVIPWHDPQKIIDLGDFLYTDTAGRLANPDIIVGGYTTALLRFTTAFPEEIVMVGQQALEISLEHAADLTLDLSLAFYRYLTELLTSPVGITGEVAVTLPGPQEGDSMVKRIPLRLVLDQPAGIDLDIHPLGETLSPDRVELVNNARCAIGVGGCVPRLLQIDSNSVVPLAVFRATSTTPFPHVLETGGRLTVLFNTETAGEALWNGVQVALTGHHLVQDRQAVLNRIHEIAPSGTLAWKIRVECPLFRAPTRPDDFALLYRLRVVIRRDGYAPQELILGADKPEAEITMQRTLQDMVGGSSADLPTFTWQVQNIWYDREGAWSDARSATGENLFVFPNPAGT